jgi:hypothetical protein
MTSTRKKVFTLLYGVSKSHGVNGFYFRLLRELLHLAERDGVFTVHLFMFLVAKFYLRSELIYLGSCKQPRFPKYGARPTPFDRLRTATKSLVWTVVNLRHPLVTFVKLRHTPAYFVYFSQVFIVVWHFVIKITFAKLK